MERKWWQDKVAYQIYPKSFYDSNNDGIGDIPGIIQKLDYLKDLGVDIIWISPCYPSPFADQGYDISDYYDINPAFGTLEDMDHLLAEAQKRDMYIILDLVVNHCSDEHEWFKKACEDPDGKYGNSSTSKTAKRESSRATGEVISEAQSGNRSRDIRTNNISTSSTKTARPQLGKPGSTRGSLQKHQLVA